MTARTLGLLLSLWLFLSAFAFPRSTASFTNAWLVGLVGAVAALAAMHRPRARHAAVALSAWLIAAAHVLPRRSGLAFWNDVVVGILMLLASLVPGTLYLPEAERRRARA